MAEDDEILLPAPEDRDWLLESLGTLSKERGFSRLVVGPLVEATPEFFPDKWAGGDASMGRLARRLLHYAGIDDLAVAVQIHREDARGGGPPPAPPGSGGVWLDGIDRGTATFMALAKTLRDPVNTVAATARAVAEVYFEHNDLKADNEQQRQRMVDVITVYLGFGLLTTDTALRHYNEADGGFRSKRSTFRLGTLGPQAMAYLLAIQLLARGYDKARRKKVLARLQANPIGFVRAAMAVLEPRRDEVVDMLALPPREQWPPPPDLEELTAPLEDELEDSEPEERKDEDLGVVDLNRGKPVFRVERSMSGRLGKVIIMATLMGGGMIARSIKGIEISMPHMILGGVVLAALGMLIGRLFEDIRCSEPKCGAPLDRDMKVCPRCGGDIVGAIKNAKERLAAEEALKHTNTEAPADKAG